MANRNDEIEKYMEIAKKQIGTKEFPPDSNNVIYNTDYYGREVSGDSYRWCMAFLWWCFKEAGLSDAFGTKTASCTKFRDMHKDRIVKNKFKYGDIILYNFSSKSKLDPLTATCTHCGFYFTSTPTTVTTIEGNTSYDSDDNGGAVMKRIRMREKIVCGIRLFGELNPVKYQNASLPIFCTNAEGFGVKSIQMLLNGHGFDCGSVDGIYGSKTKQAVKNFQRSVGIMADGEVGRDTYAQFFREG